MPDIACLGVLVADLLARPVDGMPQRGRLGLVDQMELHVGGNAANTGMDLAKLGVSSAVLGKVGADGLGDFMVRSIANTGADIRGVVRDPTVGTSGSMVLVASDGERTFIHYYGGNAEFRAADVNWDVIGEARILHVTGALLMPAFDGPPMADTMRRARSQGLITGLDTCWDATGKWMATIGPCLAHADYFLPSISEAQAIAGRTDPEDVAKALRDAGVKTVGLKLGEEGCYILGDAGALRIPAFRCNAVDGTGTGDAWNAGFLTGILNGWDLERTARFANAVGAQCVQAIGATAGVKSMDDTLAFLEAQQ
jgi:sugar/nucleoside kinase (ribokinase family)